MVRAESATPHPLRGGGNVKMFGEKLSSDRPRQMLGARQLKGWAMPEFSYRIRTEGPVTIVEISGDVDMSVAGQLTEALEPLVAAGPNVVLDCSNVAFFDSMGLRLAVQAKRQAEQVGTTFTLLPSAAVTRVLELAGVSDLFTAGDNATDKAR
jgi:anti-sigma B factor antagonist